MNRFLLCLVSVLFVAACSDDKTETDAEYEARLRAQDQELSDGTIGTIPDGTQPVSIEPRLATNMANHPLARFFIPQGYEPLGYIGDFANLCDREHSAYTEDTCDEAIERGIRVGASIGIKLTREDLDNPDYWAMRSSLWDARKKHKADYFASLGRPPNLADRATYDREFREQVNALMQNMSDK